MWSAIIYIIQIFKYLLVAKLILNNQIYTLHFTNTVCSSSKIKGSGGGDSDRDPYLLCRKETQQT